uniref:RING-type E3 ubiquitin transferase n=1 Tax=Malurus cyaneus samueli TaxID=2593467 RepID=A0A8C5X409_9PASS
MDCSVITIGHVQNVLSAMQKTLECPIWKIISFSCYHPKCSFFHRFCMFKLISKKKKGVAQCPLCKTEVTKRSLRENSRFKQLIEGLLETIRAFELDTGVKFLKSHDFPKTSVEDTASEFLCKESSVIQSKGFRNRRTSAKGQENCTLVTVLSHFHGLFKNVFGMCIHISSQERLEELESAEKENENSCPVQPDKLNAKEITLLNVIGESDFSKEGLSEKSTQSMAGCAKADQVNVTECQSSPLHVLAADLHPEQCDRIGNAIPKANGDTPFLKDAEEMDEKQTKCNSENKECDLEDSSEGRMDESKEMDAVVQSVEAVEVCEPENNSFHGKELPLEKLLQPETFHSTPLNKVSKKRLKRSIQKVNEWFSKSNEILSSSSSPAESAGSSDASGEGDLCLSVKESCISEKTGPKVDSMEIAAVEGNRRRSKQTADNIKDKIFGKTYKRERKSNTPSALRDALPAMRKEDVAAEKSLDSFSKDRLKRKRKTACALQPEDFIKKKDTQEADGDPQSGNWCLGDAEKKRCDESVAVHESPCSRNRANNTMTEPEKGGNSTWKKATEKVTSKHCDGELEMYSCDQKSTKKRNPAAKRCRHSTRTMCALQLVVDRNSVSPDPAEPQIESYPSSGEPRKADSEQNQVRRSRRLQLRAEEMTEGTRKGVKGVRKSDSDCGKTVSGNQKNVATPSAECQDLCEPQDMLSHKQVTNVKGGELETNEMQVGVKNLSATAETGKNLFNPSSSHEPSNWGSTMPGTGSEDSEIRGSPLLLQPPSVPTASHQTEEKTESPSAFPQEYGHNSQSVPKLPVAEHVLELPKEAEDSDLDTQYLRNIFRHSKRSSFSLFHIPRQEDSASANLNPSCAAQVENKPSKHLQPESLQEEKTTAQKSSRVSEKEELKTCESACVNQGILTPARTGTAETESKNRLLEEEQGNENPVSTDIGIGSELRQNPTESSKSQSDQGDTAKHVSKQTDLNMGQETGCSSESSQAGKTEADCKEPNLHFQSRSITCPAVCQQNPAEFSSEVIGTESSKSERKCTEDEEQAAQTLSTAMPKCLVAEAPEEPVRGSSVLTGSSETPDGLLCSDTDIENSSFCETDRNEQSAVFAKSDNTLGKELHTRNTSSKPRSRGNQKSRRRVQKLPSSDEESCEDEELPCFQSLICSKAASPPLQADKQMPPVVESPGSPNMFPPTGSNDDNVMQEVPEAALSNVCVSPSQESECSVNLFSSQSNASEESVNEAQELRKHSPQAPVSKQISNVNESKETSQNCNGGLRRSKDECQEDPDMGAHLGEASGYESEISIVEDSCEPFSQGEILTTQQKNAMQTSLKKLQQEMAVLEAALKQHGSQNCEFSPIHKELPHSSTEGTFGMDQMREENKRQNNASGSSNLFGNDSQSPDNPSSSVRLFSPQSAEATDEPGVTQDTEKGCGQGNKLKTSVCSSLPVLHSATGKENSASAAVTKRKEMSIVASGLNHSEHLMVRKFVKKTQSTLSNQITEGTTHVIMKTDEELVCERTLKYFLGIAGRKWVVSYLWIIQSFKEGRILDEENFEVRGDVINGRNHQGPRRARQALTEKVQGMQTLSCFRYVPVLAECLELLPISLLFCIPRVVQIKYFYNSTAVVVVQPDAWKETTDCRAIQQQNNVAMVTREWVLDSVACYECQELSAYLVS